MTAQQADEFLSKFKLVHQWSDNPTPTGSRPAAEGRTDRPQLNDEILANTGLSATLIQKLDANGNLTNDYTLSIRSTEFRDWERGGDGERDAGPTDFSGIAMNGFALAQLRALEQYYQWLKDNGHLPAGATLDVTGYSLGGHLATVFTEVHQNDTDIQFGQTVALNAPGRGTYDTTAGSLKDLIDYYGSVLENPDLAQDLAPLEATAALLSAARRAQGQPFHSKFLYDDPRYLWAKYAAETKFGTGNVLLFIQNQLNGVPDQGTVDTVTMNRITHVLGFETIRNTNATANSGIHGPVVRVGIESQPLVEGWSASLMNLLGADFGNGHSLVLLGDSLALQRAMHELDGNFTLESFIPILSGATYRVPNNRGNANYEFDALENILDGLRRVLVDPAAARTAAKEGGSGFGDLPSREGFHANLQALIDSPAFQALAGGITLGASGMGLADSARNDFGAMASLLALSPVAITARDPANQAAIDSAFQSAWGDTYTQWQADRDLAPEDRGIGRENFSDRWIADRAALLDTRVKANVANEEQFVTDRTLHDAWVYRDVSTDTILLRQPGPGGGTHQVIFGNNAAETLDGGGLEDHLYGGSGDDTLNGLGGDDHLEGGGGADTLDGGAGNDQLDGGTGADVYMVAANSGIDTVISSDAADTLQLDGRRLTGQGTLRTSTSSRTVWVDESVSAAPVTYVYDAQRSELSVSGAGSTVVVRDFVSGDLGIALPSAPAPEPAPVPVQVIDFAASNAGSLYRQWNQSGLPAATFINISAGRYRVEGGRNGDVLIGGSVLAPGERTFGGIELVGRAGDDYLYAVAEQTEAQALAGTLALPPGPSGMEGPMLDGGQGNDFIVGSASDDLAFGGAGDDRIITGDGNDMVLSDGDLGPRFDTAAEFGQAPSVMHGNNSAGFNGSALSWRRLGGVTHKEYFLDLVFHAGYSELAELYRDRPWYTSNWSIDPLDDIDLRVFAADTLEPFILPEGNATYADVVMDDPRVEPGSFDLVLRGHNRAAGFNTPGFDPNDYDPQTRLLDSFNTARYTGADVISTGAGDDVVNAGGGNDVVDAGADEDVAAGYSGSDVLDGGDGDDVLFGDYFADPAREGGGSPTPIVDRMSGLTRGLHGLDAARHGNDTLFGGQGRDLLIGNGGSDFLFGDEGDDVLQGDERDMAAQWAGNDWLNGGAGNDTLVGGGRDDELFGDEGNDVLIGDLYLTEDADAEEVIEDAQGGDRLFGDDGNDSLYGGGRDDVLDGGIGDDLLVGDDIEGLLPNYLDGNDQLSGGLGADTLLGGGGDDTLEGGADSDILVGGEGNDLLIGGQGADRMVGGAGNDVYVFNPGDGNEAISDESGVDALLLGFDLAGPNTHISFSNFDLILGFSDTDAVTLSDYFSPSLGAIELLAFADGNMLGQRDIIGVLSHSTDGADDLRGIDSQPNLLFGLAGNDSIVGGFSDDIISGGIGDDVLSGGYGNDSYIFGLGDGSDSIVDESGAQTIYLAEGLFAWNITTERVGDDLLLNWGGAESLTLKGFLSENGEHVASLVFADGAIIDGAALRGRLPVAGTEDNDYLYVRGGGWPGRLYGRGGNDYMAGGYWNDLLDGGDGNDYLDGWIGADSLYGGEGNDQLEDRFGDNLFVGGGGNDTISGGDGSDTYIFNLGDGSDTISTLNTGDALNLGIGLNKIDTRISRNRYDLILSWGSGESVTLQGYLGDPARSGRIGYSDGTLLGQDSFTDVARFGTDGADHIFGQSDLFNTIYGQAGDDWIAGGATDDALSGGDGADTIEGGKGNDWLLGGSDSDTYVFNMGDGFDHVRDVGDASTLALGEGLTEENTQVARFDQDLVLTWGELGSITIDGYFYDVDGFGQIIFSDGVAWDWMDVLDRVEYFGGAGSDQLEGYDVATNRIYGLAGDDVIVGGDLDDVISGGRGNDRLDGGGGSDTYIFNLGDGADAIGRYGWRSYEIASQDSLRLGSGLTADDVRISAPNYNLVLSWGADSITVENYFGPRRSSSDYIENIFFADGVVWNYETVRSIVNRNSPGDDFLYGLEYQANQINGLGGDDWLAGGQLNDFLDGGAGSDNLIGDSGNDTLSGGVGDDTLRGGEGDDTYVFNLGDGADRIADTHPQDRAGDTLQLGVGLSEAGTQLVRAGNDVVVSWGGEDSVTITNFYDSYHGGASPAGNIAFADGVVWDYWATASRVIYTVNGSSGNVRGAYDLPNRIYGMAGDDSISGGSKDDVLAGGAGTDSLMGGRGDDTYIYNAGDGADVLDEYLGSGTDTLQLGSGLNDSDTRVTVDNFDLVLDWGGTDSVRVPNYFHPDGIEQQSRIENIAFANGVIWNFNTVATLVGHGTGDADFMHGLDGRQNYISGLAGDDTLVGGNLDDYIEGGQGNDVLYGGSGATTFVFNMGDGADTIADLYIDKRESDTLKLGVGLREEDTHLARVGIDLVISWGGADSVTIAGFNYPGGSRNALNRIEFASGAVWDYSAIMDRVPYLGTPGPDDIHGSSDFPNRIYGLAGGDWLFGGSKDDVIVGGIGNDRLFGNEGSDTYSFSRGDGADRIDDFDREGGDIDTLAFSQGIAADQLWFRRSGSDLEVSIIGTDDKATIGGWYSGGEFHLEQFQTSDGKTLFDSQVQALVSAMAAFAPPSAGQTSLPESYQASLAPVLAAAWQG